MAWLFKKRRIGTIKEHAYEKKLKLGEPKSNENIMSEKLQKLTQQIKKQLDLCESTDTPEVCAMKDTPEGYAKIEKLIIQKVLYGDNISIADAIVEIENEYNPNALE